MVDDIVLSPEEQAEQTKEWLKKNIPSIFIGLALGISLVYGYTTYTDSKIGKSGEASALYQTIVTSSSPETQASEKVEQFKSDFNFTPYAAKTVLLHAKNLAAQGNIDDALTELKWVEENSKEELVTQISVLRQAEIYISQEKFEAANKILNQTPPLGFESNYLEMKGDVAAAQKNYAAALTNYSEALNNGNIDRGYATFLQLKINKMNSLSKSEG